MMRHNRRPLDDVLIDTTDRDGHRWSVSPSGWMHPVVSGAEGEPDPTPSPSPSPSPSPQPTPEPKPAADTVSKAEAERREKEARKETEKAIREQYGMTPEQVQKLIDDRKAAEDAKKDEVTKLREQAEERERQAEARERAAAQRERAANVRAALLEAGVKSDRLAKAERIVDVADDADEDAIKSAVDSLKADTPEWFPTGPAAGPTNLPTGPRPVNHPTNSGIAAGRERARKEREARSANQPAFGEGLTVVGGP